MEAKEISKTVIARLPRYFRYLSELKEKGTERISSKDLSKLMNVTASQIRQDLNNFGGFGQQGYGYNVDYLHGEIGKLLGLDKPHNLIICGAGSLGTALAGNPDFINAGFRIKAMFDIDPVKIGKFLHGIEVHSNSELEDFIRENDIDIAIVAVPVNAANDLKDKLIDHGIRAIWNFSNTDLDVPDDVAVENVHLLDSLMRLSCVKVQHLDS
ncbi:MAG: redox-sensing transcriptional repressor Rex [Lachnospiraceae bacterium]|nr:redox-sensing transcriptional repressor Rex [Lachnospiraceae bacterium]